VERTAAQLARQRLTTIDRLVRRNKDVIELDAAGEPARRGELLLVDANTNQLAQVEALGFSLLGTEEVGGLGFAVTRIGVPRGLSLPEAERVIARRLPDMEVSADNLHFTAKSAAALPAFAMAVSTQHSISTPVGMIDGAPGTSIPVAATRGFAKGAPFPSNHGSAVASLLARTGVRNLYVADVYGSDPAGGNALAIARALSWLVGKGSKVVTISLVGPENIVLSRAIASAQAKGTIIVAAVGNDGPAAPPAYPASYSGVVAVTGVDGRLRPLIEAGRALHLDYSAPGADVYASNAKGKLIKVRGTSFAAPLVAARAALAMEQENNWRLQLDREARDLGPQGHDNQYGRGLLCAACGRRK
jgi:subtilisin family serine protease